MATAKKPKAKAKSSRASTFEGINSDLTSLSAKYNTESRKHTGGTAQRINRASKELARLAKLFV